MSSEFTIRADRNGIDENIQLGRLRAQENFERALGLAASSPWLWGDNASYNDYRSVDPLAHQLTGELPLHQKRYRSEEYNRCNDSISKELSHTFRQEVYERGSAYLEMALDPTLSREARLITLDFSKQYLLTAFHAVQYPLRTSTVDTEKMKTIDMLANAARSATRAFYLDILGHDTERVRAEIENAQRVFADPRLRTAIEAANLAHFKAQEMDQPLTILASSLLAVNDYSETEMIFGMSAGGTQHAIVAQLLFELKRGRGSVPKLEYLPISTHSAGKTALEGRISPAIETLMNRCNPRGKNILICEDNTNTGTSLALATDIVDASSPRNLHVSITEFDPRRLEVKYRHPEPQAQIANYAHPDFTTAVGVVPVTVGQYPDIQMRKLVALRRKVADIYGQTEDMGYEVQTARYDSIPSGFFEDFYDTYRNVLRYCGDEYGYRNPHLVSAAILRHYSERGKVSLGNFEHASRAVFEVACAATLYPYLPDQVKSVLLSHEESLDYRIDGPWIRQGATALIKELIDYSNEVNGSVTIWTKGDGGTTSNPPHIGLNEQAIRYKLSGLQAAFDAVGFSSSHRGTFVAHPKKTHLLKTKILPDLLRNNNNTTDIVIIDDSEKNLAEAAQYIRLFGLRPHVINPLDPETHRTNLGEIMEKAQHRVWGTNAAFIVDMDDSLLHEHFRKYHQPRNMALALLALYPEIMNII